MPATDDSRSAPTGAGPPRVLSFTTVFPSPMDPLKGVFVHARLLHLAQLVPVRVVAPIAPIEYGNPAGMIRPSAQVPVHRTDGPLEILHPRWFYPPGFRAFHPAALATCVSMCVQRQARAFNASILDAHFGHPDGIAAAILADRLRLPFTITLRGNETMHARSAPVRRKLSWAVRRAAGIIAVSKPLAGFAAELGAPADSISVIPNGIDASVFHPRPPQQFRHQFGMSEDRLHILSAGYLIERKGHHTVAAALPRLHAAGLPADLWIAGGPGSEGDFAETISDCARRHGVFSSVHFLGPLPPEQLAAAMSAADLFCLASSREGWPNVVNEALACGAPVVATDVGGTPHMIADGRFGIVVPPGDAQSLAAALDTALRRSWDRDIIADWGARRSWRHVALETRDALLAAWQKATIGKS